MKRLIHLCLAILFLTATYVYAWPSANVPYFAAIVIHLITGAVFLILLTIGPDGVSDVRVWESSGYPARDRAALQAAKESTYSVPEVNGEPVTETYRIIYTFALNS